MNIQLLLRVNVDLERFLESTFQGVFKTILSFQLKGAEFRSWFCFYFNSFIFSYFLSSVAHIQNMC